MELEPNSLEANRQLSEGIVEFYELLKGMSGVDGPNVLIETLFDETDEELHGDLRSALFQLCESDWITSPEVNENGEINIVLKKDEGRFHFF